MDQLLSLLQNENICTLQELSDKSGMTKEMVLARLERYEQLGIVKKYVKETDFDEGDHRTSCSGRCGSCKGCSFKMEKVNPECVWRVTES